VHTFPETGFFLKALGMRGTVLPWACLGLTLGKERKALARILPSQKGASGVLPELPPRHLSLSRSVEEAMGFLDGLAEAHGKDVWVEKTPRHVLHARRIHRLVPDALCIHMVRRGEDVVASIVDRARKYPHRFPRQAKPAYGVRQWNRSLEATVGVLDQRGHAVVVYEQLVSALESTIHTLCGIIGLAFEEEMLIPADRSAFTDPSEEWKSAVNAPVAAAPSKFEGAFPQDVRRWITGSLNTALWGELVARGEKASGGVLVSG